MTQKAEIRLYIRLRKFMAKHNLKRRDLVQKFETPVGTVRHWLSGKVAPPAILAVFMDILENVPEARKFLEIEERKE